jgi:6-methylsalicylate decarboxylase
MHEVSRREFLARAGALTALAGMPMQTRSAGGPDGRLRRIDVHHHVSPPPWLEAVRRAQLDFPQTVAWTVQRSLEDMDAADVGTSVVSPTMPQVGFLGPQEAARVARESNEYVRTLASEHPGRFGMFAMLPMPHVDESLKEIEHAFDALKADGIGMMTSYGDRWLGYPEFTPVLEELNRRKATVYTHPNRANCCVNLVRGVPEAVVEFGADTTRTIASLLFSGATLRLPGVTFIFSHGGGALTAVVERFQDFMVRTYKERFTREIVDAELRRFYYDTAQVSNPVTMAALTKLVPLSQIVFGSDFPFRSSFEHVKGLAAIFGEKDQIAIGRENALRILPRLGRSGSVAE